MERHGPRTSLVATSTLRSVFLTVLDYRLLSSFKNGVARKFANRFRQPWVSNMANKTLKFKILVLDILTTILLEEALQHSTHLRREGEKNAHFEPARSRT